jgi:Concanavalin A-like lectin/glucanases superfamily
MNAETFDFALRVDLVSLVRRSSMLETSILDTEPTSYWPLTDVDGATCHDEMGLHDAVVNGTGVKLAAIPFGDASAPYFDGEIGSFLTIASDPQYSQPFANSFSIIAWMCPLALDNAHTVGSVDQYVHFLEKAVDSSTQTEWAMRLYNQTNPNRHSRASFYTFNLTPPPDRVNLGNGAYMEYGVSANDTTPVAPGGWLFLVGQAEPWISESDPTTGCVVWKQGVKAVRTRGDKYVQTSLHVHPQHGMGPISIGGTNTSGFKGSIAHVAIWNRLLSPNEIALLWTEGQLELRNTPMYHSYL